MIRHWSCAASTSSLSVPPCQSASGSVRIKAAESYEEAVKQAVMLGDDTDTTACVAGGLAGIVYGEDGIPVRWLKALRGREVVEELLIRAFGN